MEKSHWIGAAVVIAGLVAVISVRPKTGTETPSEPAPSSATTKSETPYSVPAPPAASAPGTARPAAAPIVSQAPPAPPPATASVPPIDPDDIPRTQPKPALPPATRDNVRQAIDDLDIVIRDFRTAIGGNPVGTNAEITSALLGNNLKQVKLSLPNNSQVNGNGELCDVWGTPYFFHQKSGTLMEIISAGPDRKLWTGDDVPAQPSQAGQAAGSAPD